MQMYDEEAELSSSGIFELVYEHFVVQKLDQKRKLNYKKTHHFLKYKSDAFGIILKLNQSSIILPQAFFTKEQCTLSPSNTNCEPHRT